MSHHLMGVGEIADLLGVSRQRVDALFRSDPAFPAPTVELLSGRVWERAAVEAWAAQRRDRRRLQP